MITTYYISQNVRLLLYALLILGLPLQSYIVVLSRYIYKETFRRQFEWVLLLIQAALGYLMSMELLEFYYYGISDNLLKLLFPTILYIAIIIRALYYLPRLWKTKEYRITAMSIKESIDNLDLGLMVYDKKRVIVLLNNKMTTLMIQLFNEVYRDGGEYWADIKQLKPEAENSVVKLKDSILIRRREDSWEFSDSILTVGNKTFTLLLAKNMTERDEKIMKLETIGNNLNIANEEYEQLLDNVKQMVDAEEKLSMKVRLHDSLGQQFSIIQSILRSENQDSINYEIIQPANIMDTIRGDELKSPRKMVSEIVDFFNKIGIVTTIFGEFPKNHQIATIFFEIIREATTNAVMHAGATKLDIVLSEDENNYKLEVANNGSLPESDIIEGGGIKGMRYRLRSVNGSLMVQSLREFKITAIVSKL